MKTILAILLISVAAFAGPSNISQTPAVVLAWDASDEPDIAGYRVHLGRESGVYTEVIGVGIGELWDDAGVASRKTGQMELPDTGTWFCALTAYDSYGTESDFSNEISFTRNRPAAPTGLRMTVSVQVSSNLRDWQSIASLDRPRAKQEFFRVVVASAGP